MSREIDPEKDYRNWRYSWEKPWKKGLKVKKQSDNLKKIKNLLNQTTSKPCG